MTIKELRDNNLLLLDCISGSKAYGISTATSDTDLKGVYYLPKEKFYGLEYIDQVSNETNDEVYYELGRFIELLGKNNPNLLEMLASPADCILFRHPIMDKLPMKLFLSKLCKESFGGYAMTQIRKARGYNKKIVNPVSSVRKGLLEFCYIIKGHTSVSLNEWLDEKGIKQADCGLSSIPHSKGLYALFHNQGNNHSYSGIISSDAANEVSLSSIPKGEKELAYLYVNQDGYSSYCKEYREYWEWVAKRNDARYQGNAAHGKDYDAKNMMHTIRLLQVCLEIGETGQLNVHRNNKDELLAIKSGQFEYQELVTRAEGMLEEIEIAYQHADLQEAPDQRRIESILVDMRNELYNNEKHDNRK